MHACHILLSFSFVVIQKPLKADQVEFDPDRFNTEPYIMWIDEESFKSSTMAIQNSLDMCGYQRVWKFKNVDRMKVFLEKSMASEYIRVKGTKFVFVSSGGLRDGKAAVELLQSMDVLPMLGMVLLVADTKESFDYLKRWMETGSSISPAIRDRLAVCDSWASAASTLMVWKHSSLSVR